MDTTAFLQRALSALDMPTLYWLGKGGHLQAEARQREAMAQPGRRIDVAREYEQMRVARPTLHAEYAKGLVRMGLSLADLPTQACDCSGFVCWALGVARDGSPLPGRWLSTDNIYEDATGAQRLFKTVDRASPGVLVVYPRPLVQEPDGTPGHIGIVTEVDADGAVTRVLHCAPDNFERQPPAGKPRNAIAETGQDHFTADPRTRCVTWLGFEAAA